MPLAKFTMLGRLMDQASPYEFTQTFTLSSGYEKNILELKFSAMSAGPGSQTSCDNAFRFQGITSGKYLYAEIISCLDSNGVYFITSRLLSTGVSGANLSLLAMSRCEFVLKANEFALLPLAGRAATEMYWTSFTRGGAFARLIFLGL